MTKQLATSKPCWGCDKPGHRKAGHIVLTGRKGQYCEECATQRIPHLFPGPKSLMAYCGTVVRFDREAHPLVEQDHPTVRGEVHPDTCGECLIEVWSRGWGWAW